MSGGAGSGLPDLDQVPVPYLRLDRQGRIVLWNRRTADLMGWMDADVAGQNFAATSMPPAERVRLERHLENVAANPDLPGPRRLPITVKLADGRRVPMDAITWSTPNASTVDVMLREILPAPFNADAAAAAEQVAAGTRELEDFVFAVSHDLKAPLRAVTGFADLLLRDFSDPLDERGRGMLGRIVRAAQDMRALIDNLLNLSRANRLDMTIEPVDLSALAATALAACAQAEPERRVAVDIALDLEVNADAYLVKLLMEAVLDNAWKFTSRTADATIEVGAAVSPQPVFYVRDNGAGMVTQDAHAVFEPFRRLHSAFEFPGSGVGLATALRVVQRHGGRIWLESAPQQGTTVYFTLGPADPPASNS